MIFNSYEPSEPPDFIFSDQNFTPDIENIKVCLYLSHAGDIAVLNAKG